MAEPTGSHRERTIERSPIQRMLRADGFSMGGLTLWKLIGRVWSSANEDDIVDRAAELAYYFLFALFPAMIFLSGMFRVFADKQTQSNIEWMLYLGKIIPPAAFGLMQTAFTATTTRADTGNILFGAIAALWAATYGMSSAQSVLNSVYRVKEGRPYWKAKGIALALTLAIIVLVFCAMLLLLLGNSIAKWVADDWLLTGSVPVVWKTIQVVASVFFISMVFSLTYHWGPDRRGHKWRWISPGAIIGIVGWVAASLGFRLYLHFFNSYAVLYGSLGTVIILLTWFYVSGLMLLLGAEINATIDRTVLEKSAAAFAI